MHALVTGGAGFIGSHLCDLLIERGHSVDLLDDLSTGTRANVAGVLEHSGGRLSVGSACDPQVVDPLVSRADLVFHLAAAVGVELVVEAPVRTIETNIHATNVVLAAAARRQVPVLIASTSEVYGKSAALPFREDGDLVLGPTTSPRWSYAASKALDEFLALAYTAERGLPVTVARLFNTVGPRQAGRYGMVVPRFVCAALMDDDLLIHGDGRQTRCFIHVSDVVRALADLATMASVSGEVFNVGATDEISVVDLARRVIEATGSNSALRYIPYAEAFGPTFEDMRRRRPDTSKIEAAIGWRPTFGLDDILADTIAHARLTPSARSQSLL